MSLEQPKPGFAITQSKGFQITLANGWTVSVQFGPMNYCEARSYQPDLQRVPEDHECMNAETAVIDPTGELVTLEGHSDSVQGWQTPEDVLRLLQMIAEKD